MNKTTHYELDLEHLPPLTQEQSLELVKLASMPESEVDFSDTPETLEEFWKDAERGRFFKPLKKHASVRIDADVLDWLKGQGKGYQTRLNAILRDAMLRALHR